MFNSPVTTTCGHNFCRTCITKLWDEDLEYKCPVCNELFHKRPYLQVNSLLSESVDQFRMSVRVKVQPCVKPVEIPCDFCNGTQPCLISYCQTHLEPHQRVAGQKKHLLGKPMDRLEDRMCKKHNQLLELFCRTEQVSVCQFCTEDDHKSHPVVPLKEEYEMKMAQLGKIETEVPRMIQERKLKIKEFEEADRQIADVGQVLTALISCVEKWQDDFNKSIEENQKSTEKQTEDQDLVKELKQEIEDLTNRCSEMKQLSYTKDHLHFLQAFRSLKDPPPTRDWTSVEVRPPSSVGTFRRSLDQLKEKLLCFDADLKRVQQYEIDVTLDPDTTHSVHHRQGMKL